MGISDRELRERLVSYGCNPPPVTDNSRDLLLKKLKQLEAAAGSDNHVAVESKSRKPKATRRDSTPEKNENSRRVNNDVSRVTNNSKKDADEVDFDAKKVKNSTPLVLVEKYRRDPFEKGSDSEDSYSSRPSSTTSYLARKPLSVRRDTEFYSSPTNYSRKHDFDNGASSYLNRNMHRSFNVNNRSNEWSKKFNRFAISTSSTVLVIFILFFLTVGYIYYSQNDQVPGELFTDLAEKPFCSKRGKEGISCVMDANMESSLTAWKILYKSLHSAQVKVSCNGDKVVSPILKYDDAVELLSRELSFFRYEAEEYVKNVIVLMKANPKFKVKWSDAERRFYLENPDLPWSCALKHWFLVFFEYAFSVLLAVCFIVSMHILFRYVIRQREERSKGTQELIKGILDILQQNAIANPSQNFMPIVHVRDQLISYADRERKRSMWADAVKDVEQNESRVRKEVQMYQGEDYDVWRWVGGHQQSSPKPKTWQGEAFETSKDNMNTPATSPTPCLKIRHMFNPKFETEDDDWVTVVKDAILERCEGINIVHMSVDEASPDGCVYIKCASTEDAGKAFRKIHGAWFDGKIISVKYLRLERYHERFPNSTNYNTPLVPSNDQKRSIVL